MRVLPRLELFESSEADIRYHHDMFILMPAPESKGVRVLVK
jgi:hypothetical protein